MEKYLFMVTLIGQEGRPNNTDIVIEIMKTIEDAEHIKQLGSTADSISYILRCGKPVDADLILIKALAERICKAEARFHLWPIPQASEPGVLDVS